MSNTLWRRAFERAASHWALRNSSVAMLSFAALVACAEKSAPKPSAVQEDSVAAVAKTSSIISPDTASRTLAAAVIGGAYHVDDTPGAQGTISGNVTFVGTLPVDSTVTPNRDSTGCRPFDDVTFPRARTSRSTRATSNRARTTVASAPDSVEHDVGNAVAWLVGVTHGPRDAAPRRVNMVLDDCHIDPRVSVAPAGATLNISNRDDMIVKLRFADQGRADVADRVVVGFTDPGQVVPSAIPLAKPGLVEVTDQNHLWVHAFIAVAPHPFVAVTEADGDFVFEAVPAGEYQLVVWHERLGARVVPVRVEKGATATVAVKFERKN